MGHFLDFATLRSLFVALLLVGLGVLTFAARKFFVAKVNQVTRSDKASATSLIVASVIMCGAGLFQLLSLLLSVS
ncbi:hypothetical protein SAMN06295943_2346 [Agreia sp. VKM Ac-1783]|nr:hypothetical protein SAMN06295943_2346 [Agreia sp. VKM Ac-1783]